MPTFRGFGLSCVHINTQLGCDGTSLFGRVSSVLSGPVRCRAISDGPLILPFSCIARAEELCMVLFLVDYSWPSLFVSTGLLSGPNL
ncbi:hypothetical protein AAC387_Pa03g2002 [Persea americana]